jgi:two-component system, NtrC family, sensor kinase
MSDSFLHPNRRVLVVDDNAAIHADFKKILCPVTGDQASLDAAEASIFGEASTQAGPEGFEVDSAFQGQEGFALVQKSLAQGQPYAMVFMDVRMPPGWDGIETTARIWEIDPHIQIIICTAYSDYSWDEMIKRLGISDRLVILKKPFDNVEVIQLAHALSEKWRLRQEARLKMEQLEQMVAQRTRELQSANEQLKVEMAERARTEDALRQSQKMDALGQLAGGIAHDFNNLLTVIRGYVDCLLAEGQQTSDGRSALEEIDQAAERAAKLTSQMLMFSRKKRMQPQVLALNEVVQRIGHMLHRFLGETIALEVHCPPEPLVVRADPVMIEQIILNLAVNARDAMPKGGQLVISAAAAQISEDTTRKNPKARAGHFARLSVADVGSGIAPGALPHLFEPFFTTKEPGKGTGLGLATVFGIVQQHHGWVDVENRPGQGATFHIYIPLGIPRPHAPAATPQKMQIPSGTETVLLVEDEPVVRRLARTMLQRHGYRVFEGDSGENALAVWREHQSEIDVLLTDMVMPGKISGRELGQTLQSQKPSLKVIYTTGYSLDALHMDHSLEEGVNFLAKPYTLEKLALTVRRCIDHQQNPATSAPANRSA